MRRMGANAANGCRCGRWVQMRRMGADAASAAVAIGRMPRVGAGGLPHRGTTWGRAPGGPPFLLRPKIRLFSSLTDGRAASALLARKASPKIQMDPGSGPRSVPIVGAPCGGHVVGRRLLARSDIWDGGGRLEDAGDGGAGDAGMPVSASIARSDLPPAPRVRTRSMPPSVGRYHQARFARARAPRDRAQDAERDARIDVLEVVLLGPQDLEEVRGFRRVFGTSMRSVPLRKRPVGDCEFLAISLGVPWATIFPPSRPTPGSKSST